MANSQHTVKPRDRILLVESDPAVSDLIGRQALQSAGYQVQVAADGNAAMAHALKWAPDLILLDLDLTGLSGKDLMVALASQGIQVPLIVIARRGKETDIIQTFRLGAADYLLLPAREAEVINAVGRVLEQVHERRDRERLAQQLQQANQELQARVRELTTIFALGKAMTSVTDQSVLLEKILDSAVRITQSDLGWFLLREDTNRPFVVVAQRNLPEGLGVQQNHPWDDGISSLVAMSGEALSIYGDSLRRFKISSLGLAALIVPVKAQKSVIGLLVMMRRAAAAFHSSDQHMLTALADYASISLVNARLFRAVEERARSLQKTAEAAAIREKVQNEVLRLVNKEISDPLQAARVVLDNLSRDPLARWRPEQRMQLASAQEALLWASETVQQVSAHQPSVNSAERAAANLIDLVTASLRRFYTHIQRSALQVQTDLPAEVLQVYGDAALLSYALDGVFSNAVKFSPAGGKVSVSLKRGPEGAHLIVGNNGKTLTDAELEKAFDEKRISTPAAGAARTRSGGPGIHLSLVREIILRQNGKIWLESQQPHGVEVHILLSLAR